jgi:hypothetical protein
MKPARLLRRRPQPLDAVIVGAGPAGLFTALTLLITAKADVLIVDAGPDVDERMRESVGDGRRDDVVHGVGGAGMFSDGKLCLSLDVGGTLGTVRPAPELRRLLELVSSAFGVEAYLGDAGSETSSIHALSEAADGVGLSFGYYPVAHVGTEHCAEYIRRIRNLVCLLGGRFVTRTEARRVVVGQANTLRVVVANGAGESVVDARRVVLAMGKSGSDLQRRMCEGLGARTHTVPMYVGVRLETPEANAAPLFGQALDPKYKLHFPDGTKVKTHCAGRGGFVLPVRYEGLPLAGGHSFRSRKSGRSSFGVLWNGIRTETDPYRYALDLMRRNAALSDGRLLVQRLDDYLARRRSTRLGIEEVGPTTDCWEAGDLRQVLPEPYFDAFDSFVARLAALAPQLCAPESILYAPAIEWWMMKIETDAAGQTSIPGLYVAGDGAGWSQGTVHSAATGIVIGEAIGGSRVSRRAVVDGLRLEQSRRRGSRSRNVGKRTLHERVLQ